jgi:hypothetical protein
MPRPGFTAHLVAQHQPRRHDTPPADLGPVARAVWVRTLALAPPGHFQTADEPLMRRFVAATLNVERVETAMAAESDPAKLKPLADAHASLSRTVVAIGGKLRLWGHRRKPLPPMSPLERAKMEGRI